MKKKKPRRKKQRKMKIRDEYIESEFRALDKRLNSIYRSANKAASHELGEYLSNYKGIEKSLLKDVKNGLKTDKEYEEAVQQEVFDGSDWESERSKCADILCDADEESADYANSRTDEIYTTSYNMGTYHAEMHYRRDVGIAFLTVAALAASGKHPKTKVFDRSKDFDWNMKNLQRSVQKYTERGRMLTEVGKRAIKATVNKNKKATYSSLQFLLWGVAEEGEWEEMMDLKSKGFDIQKCWIATKDKVTRDTHRILDGQVRDVEKPYEVRGYEIMYPRQNTAPPEMIINCRCSQRRIYPDLPNTPFNMRENVRNGRGIKNVIPWMNYKDWSKWKYGS